MFQWFKSLFRVLRAKDLAAAQALEDEHIEALADQAIVDAEKGFEGLKGDYAAVLAELEKNRSILAEHQQKARDYNKAAENAMRQNDEELAREALQRAMTEEESVMAMTKTVMELEDRVGELKSQLQQYQKRLEEARREKKVLVARKHAAESTERIQKTMNKVRSSANAFAVMDRLKESVADAEARVTAEKEMAGDVRGVDSRLQEMTENANLGDRMQALRAKIEQGEAATE